MKVPNLREFRPDSSQAKDVDNTPMLDTNAKETVDMNESNVVGKEEIVSHPAFGELGMLGRK